MFEPVTHFIANFVIYIFLSQKNLSLPFTRFSRLISGLQHFFSLLECMSWSWPWWRMSWGFLCCWLIRSHTVAFRPPPPEWFAIHKNTLVMKENPWFYVSCEKISKISIIFFQLVTSIIITSSSSVKSPHQKWNIVHNLNWM